jgi:hypothetical protein
MYSGMSVFTTINERIDLRFPESVNEERAKQEAKKVVLEGCYAESNYYSPHVIKYVKIY